MAKKDIFTRDWIITNSVEVLQNYPDGMLTIRGLYYQLVAIGMTNSLQHYKRVVAAMGVARWDGIISFDAFSDRDRQLALQTKAEETTVEEKEEEARTQVRLWIKSYIKNRWENQIYYPEVLIEKKALEGVFLKGCKKHDIALGACKGYPSLTFLKDTSRRFNNAIHNGKKPIILYFGDYDPSGEDIPRSLEETLRKMGCDEIEVRRIALMEEQVIDWNLPPAPAKLTDSRTANWGGIGQVELDAVKPEKLLQLLDNAVAEIFDTDLHFELLETEAKERIEFQRGLLKYVNTDLCSDLNLDFDDEDEE